MATRAKIKKQGRASSRRSDLLTNLFFVFPLFLVYEVGVLAIPTVHNGADLITSEMLHLLHGNAGAYLAVNGALAVGFAILCLVLRRSGTFDARMFLPVLLESAIYALTMGTLICFVMVDFLHIDPKMSIAAAAAARPEEASTAAKLILAVGAGVHEELMFRLIMVGGGVWLLERVLGMRRIVAIIIAFAVSSLLFSAAHHVIGGEPWRLGVFTYRVLCGLFFATLFQTRGLAVAVYTHALYDIYVLIVRS
jgi:hypothetical protein